MSKSTHRPPCPFMKFYPTDFLGDSVVCMMSTTAVGAYILLLCHAWQQPERGTLPNNRKLLARWSRLTLDEWDDVKDEVLLAFHDKGDMLVQNRMVAEATDAESRRKKLSEAGKRGSEKRWGNKGSDSHPITTLQKGQDKVNSNHSHNHNHNQSQKLDDEVNSSEIYTSRSHCDRAWESAPSHKRRARGRFREAWVLHVIRPKADIELVINAISEYYESHEGQGEYARGLVRLITDEFWTEESDAWSNSLKTKKGADALDEYLSQES
jgi:uncharacterized protein YdaU (DUF1376 family)